MARRYIVKTEFSKGVGTILRTDDYDRAAECANFWDERQNTWLIDTYLETPLDRALRHFDEAIERFSVRERN